MPYITKQSRRELGEGREPNTTGELNYLICMTAHADGQINDIFRVLNSYKKNELTSYGKLNDIMGALDGARRELIRRGKQRSARTIEYVQSDFYRETVADYEELAINRNGDIFQ